MTTRSKVRVVAGHDAHERVPGTDRRPWRIDAEGRGFTVGIQQSHVQAGPRSVFLYGNADAAHITCELIDFRNLERFSEALAEVIATARREHPELTH
jgi:hypothetical protein